jgi:RimJ/RimL family protein N-acetyltransferase
MESFLEKKKADQITPEEIAELDAIRGDELGEVEVLYGLAKAYWGRGIATQATKASISYGFNVANPDRLIAMALSDNQASKRVIEKSGLHYEKQIHMFNLDGLYYSIVRSQHNNPARAAEQK